MTVVTSKFRSRPFFVDAVQVTKENFEAIADWCGGTIETDANNTSRYINVKSRDPMRARHTKAFIDDWVLHSEYYGYKVYTPGAFRKGFEPADIMESVETVPVSAVAAS